MLLCVKQAERCLNSPATALSLPVHPQSHRRGGRGFWGWSGRILRDCKQIECTGENRKMRETARPRRRTMCPGRQVCWALPVQGRKYASAGCLLSLHHSEKPEHEEVCEFRPYTCPCPGASCKWQGSLEAVMPHLMHAHKSITTLQGEDIVFLATDINLPGAVDWVMMQSCFGHHFMLVLEKQEKYEGHQQFFAMCLFSHIS
ncbi:UNVERIFIED_CONTAM: hypothetical protein FKN15_000215 [Acipenser sinensis]